MGLFSRFGARLALAAVAFVLATPAHADIQSIRSSNNSIWGAVGSSLLNYKEAVSPIPDSEHEFIPSISGGYSYMGMSNIYFAIDGAVSFGDTKYTGAIYNSGTGSYDIPYEGTTENVVTSISARVGKGYALGRFAMLTPYGELGYRYWDRKLSSTQDEEYDNFSAAVGLMLQASPVKRMVLTGYGSAGVTFAGNMATDGVDYELGSAGIYKVGGKVGFVISPRWEWFTMADYTHFRYVRSPVINSVYEPSSRTNETTLRTGFAFHFR